MGAMGIIIKDYLFLLGYMALAMCLGFLLFTLVYWLTPKKADYEKTSAYECGFEPFSDASG